jgi:hypothetical protein
MTWAMPQLRMVFARPLTAEERVRSEGKPCGICGGRSALGTGFSPSIFPPVIAVSQMRHTRSSIYHRRYTNLAVDSIVNNTLQKENNDLVIQRVSYLVRRVFTHLVITGALCNGPVFLAVVSKDVISLLVILGRLIHS